jgi:hypothetical protein
MIQLFITSTLNQTQRSTQDELNDEDAQDPGQGISTDRISLVSRYRTDDSWKDGGVFEWDDGSSDDLASGHQGVSIFFGGT